MSHAGLSNRVYGVDLGSRTPQQVSDRLDELITKIHKLQSPYMHGEKPADVMLVCFLSIFKVPFISGKPIEKGYTLLNLRIILGCPWSYSPCFYETLVKLPNGIFIVDDDGARRNRGPEVITTSEISWCA